VPREQELDELVGVGSCAPHLHVVGEDGIGATHVMGVFGPVARGAAQDDVSGLVDLELGAFDEVGEVGLVEGQVTGAARLSGDGLLGV